MSNKYGKPARRNRTAIQQPKKAEPSTLVMLRHGATTNFMTWKEAMRNEIAQRYGSLLAAIIDHGEIFDPPDVDEGQYDLDNDPHGIQRHRLMTAITCHQKAIATRDNDEPKVYALMWQHLSRESIEAVLRHEGFNPEENLNDAGILYRAIKATHPVGGGALDGVSRRAHARQAYKSMRQGPMETIAEFKTRFTFAKEAYDDTGNVELPADDVAMDFLAGLDDARYARFKADLENDRAKGENGPQTLNDMYHRASTFVVVKSNWKPTSGVAFTTALADDQNQIVRNNKKTNRKNGTGNAKRGKRSADKTSDKDGGAEGNDQKDQPKKKHGKTVICFNCNQPGHYANACPQRPDQGDDGVEHNSAFVTLGLTCTTMLDTRSVPHWSAQNDLVSNIDLDKRPDWGNIRVDEGAPVACAVPKPLKWYEVLLDNQANTSVVRTRLLRQLTNNMSYISGLSGDQAPLHYEGYLDGFFWCKGSDDVIASVLCQADVEDLYRITYVQGVSYTVHMPDRDLVFRKRGKLYIGDMREWDQSHSEEGDVAMVTTAQDNEAGFTRAEVKRARQARELVKNAGYSSENEALSLVSDGNFTGVPITARDVKMAFQIYGKSVYGTRGRRTAQKVKTQSADEDVKTEHGELQTMYGDVAYIRQKPYMFCVSKPLGLITVTPLANTKTRTLGVAVQSHVSMLQSRGFLPKVIHLDPQRGFAALDTHIPGVEVDVGGAGDHVNHVDVEIRHVKEIYRSVHESLPWTQPVWLDKDLMTFCVSRKNLRRSTNSVVSARVKFTGRKPDFKKELGIAYGDYCECYDPNVVSNSATTPRTAPCIALYPTGNANGSWVFLNINTKKRVRRTNWQPMVTTQLIIDAMNRFSEDEIDAAEPEAGEEQQQVDQPPAAQQEPVAEPERQPEPTGDAQPEAEVEPQQDVVVEPEEQPEAEEDARQEEAPPRRSARVAAGARRPERYRVFHTSVRKGLKEHGAHAYKAIVAELRQLLQEKKALQPVKRSDMSGRQLKKVIRSLMFLKTKFDAMGRFEKIKARLVANGKQQDRELYPDTYSPTVKLQSMMMCLTVAVKEARKVRTVDIGGAYLNAERNADAGEEIIMELEPMLVSILAKVAPEIKPFVDEKGRLLAKLNKAMYGTLDAAKIWYEKLTGVLRSMGFEANSVDECVFNKTVKGVQCTIMVYVDDLLVTCAEDSILDEVISQLGDHFEGDVKSSRDKDLSYLGMHMKIEDGRITVRMDTYLADLLDELGVTGTAASPATSSLFVINKACKALGRQEAKKFHTTVAKLLYLSKRVRIDVLVVVAFLCSRVQCPTTDDQFKLDRLLRYLNGTRDSALVLEPSGDLRVEGYIDASFGCHHDGKSHTGVLVTVGGCTVLSASSKQKIVTRNSTEAELVALSDKLLVVTECQEFLKAQGVDVGVPVVYQDNTSTISLVTKGGGQYRNRYMRVRQAFLQERVQEREAEIRYLETGNMKADMFTKPLQGALFRDMARRITGR